MLGFRWGSHVESFLAERPDARLVRDRGDVRTYSLAHLVVPGGTEVRARFLFEWDELRSVTLEPGPGPPDALSLEGLVQAASSGFTSALEPTDEGFDVVVEGRTRMAVDRLDGRLVLEEHER